MKRYNNYHKHSHRSNVFSPDTHIKNEAYAKRAIELGHTNIFSTEHGYGGSIFEIVDLALKYNLNPIYAMEGYIVADAKEKDNGNYHIVIVPKNNSARKKLNLANSNANMYGYYYKPRLFLNDLLSLNKDDFYITTACCGGLLKNKDSFEGIFLPLYNHFKENIFLEVQPHNVDSQKRINERAIELSRNLGVKIIHANDSHYIYPEDAKDRLQMLKGKGITYGEEDSYILDYPDYDAIIERYKIQGVLTEEQAIESLNNTLIFDNIVNIEIDKLIKMPNIYKELSVDERVTKLKQLSADKFQKIIKTDNITPKELPLYITAIREEMEVIEQTKDIHSMDYFLLNEKIVYNAVNKYNGYLTPTSRGSGGAFLLNKVLGMTQLDRIRSEIPLYPERFMSAARLLGDNPPYTSSLPDFDFNVVSDEPFVKASRDELGEHGCYPMTAYGTMKEGEAFRNTCRSKGLNYDEYNEVAKNLDAYRNDSYWGEIIEESNKFNGVIISASVHPCSYLLLDKDLREEIGVIKIGDVYCCPITSTEADDWHYLKNDYLKVESISLAKNTFEMANINIPSLYEFKSMLDDKVWDIYSNGITCAINQFDSLWATSMSKEYKPKNVKEVAMFNGAIRPNFNDYRDMFMKRDVDFTNGNEFLDKLFEPTDKWILYQENLMQFFEALGIKPSESIDLIKKISKKKIKPEMFDALVERLKNGWLKEIGNLDDFDETWEKIQTFMSYGYNTPHSLAMAYDSLYNAYLKAHLPLYFYSVALDMYSGDTERTNRLTEELKYFNIKINPPKFRYSKAKYHPDKETNSIYKGLASIKFMNDKVSEELYELKNNKYNNFLELLIDLEKTSINSRQLEILIKLDFFSDEFGKSQKLLDIVEAYNSIHGKKQFKKDKLPLELTEDIVKEFAGKETEKMFTQVDTVSLLNKIIEVIPNKSIPIEKIFEAHLEYVGYIDWKDTSYEDKVCVISDLKTNKWGTVFATLYRINTGTSMTMKVDKRYFANKPLEKFDIIKVATISEKFKRRKVEGKWIVTDELEYELSSYSKIIKED